jgi:hypothetical protein
MISPKQALSPGKVFTVPLAILYRPKVHPINKLVPASFRCSDFVDDMLQGASARSQQADSGQRRSNPYHQNEGISPDKPG